MHSKYDMSSPLFAEFDASGASRKHYLGINSVVSDASRKNKEKLSLYPNTREVKVRLFYFKKRTNYLSSRSEYLFPKSASPPPSESNGRPNGYMCLFVYYATTRGGLTILKQNKLKRDIYPLIHYTCDMCMHSK